MALFDYNFFNISPKEAEAMDPQQRILLECVYEAIEAAGLPVDDLRGSSTAVFVGQMSDDYHDILLRDIDSVPQYTGTGTSRAIMANRVSYFFDWRGPSMNIDTACSSSLVALHQAVQTIRRGESQIAVVAGVNLIMGPERFIIESKLKMLSPSGRSRMWDAGADGYARGEGFAVVVLRTKSQAIIDNSQIECIIREVGVNQDGRSAGLTVPSSESQSSLIRSTYARCGLDCRRTQDRCQYFEAHGTGTLTGDPKEAAALHDAFFRSDEKEEPPPQDRVLYVGSVKTVVGHSEGTAGLAGLLKASLAVQHGEIPPNLHFSELNPMISPYYSHLLVPVELQPWPELPSGVPRRVSLNSFGFGGTNAHAIIESWECGRSIAMPANSPGIEGPLPQELPFPAGPFILSANSDSALIGAVTGLRKAISTSCDGIDMDRLAWTLQTGRTEFPYKKSFSGTSKEQLLGSLEEFLQATSRSQQRIPGATSIRISEKHPLRILGIFTGQGAQWPSMGKSLYSHCRCFRDTIDRLEVALLTLPNPPSWSLSRRFMVPGESENTGSEISQPMTTALQIGLVDLLNASGISFKCVIGHSSGEIAAVYAAGLLSASDAIRIAYYRGLHTLHAGFGKMMAVGMSHLAAQDFCASNRFLGRICVAASNSVSNVTLSGDADGIDEAKKVLGEKGIFCRIIKVDRAYHSSHMELCSRPFLQSLRQCNIVRRTKHAKTGCAWYSSVYGSEGRIIDGSGAHMGQYWADNMLKPVLFSQAVDRAVREEHCFDLVLEVGPHPALKAPTSETLKALTAIDVPYHGTLNRGVDDRKAFCDALGFVWENVYPARDLPSFERFRRACLGTAFSTPRIQKNLPPYCWDHNRVLLKESVKSKLWSTQECPTYELLGRPHYIGGNDRLYWRNIMKLEELDWLRGHQFQNQVLIPAASYIPMAYEAAIRIAGNQPVDLVILEDLHIEHPITLEDDSPGIETHFVMNVLNDHDGQITAEYSCYSGSADAALVTSSESRQRNLTGKATIKLGMLSGPTLPPRLLNEMPLTDISTDRFYQSALSCGLRYSGDFRLDSIKRRSGFSTVTMRRLAPGGLRVHPATLDAAFQGLLAAFSYPGDGKLWTAYLPTRIKKVRISSMCPSMAEHVNSGLVADCYMRNESPRSFCGDVELFCGNDGFPEIQIEGLTCTSLTAPSAADDKVLFARNVWKRDISADLEPEVVFQTSTEDDELYEICERSAYFYLRHLRHEVSRSEIDSMEGHCHRIMSWALNYLLPLIEKGVHPRIKAEWGSDTSERIMGWKDKFANQVNIQLIHAVGNNLPLIVRNVVPALQVLTENNMLSRFYKEGLGAPQANSRVGALAASIAHRYPAMNILEIGAGSGGATATVLERISNSFGSYTFTDVSPSFFQEAREKFVQHGDKIKYRLLDIERSPAEQGFQHESFDLVIASNVLHATSYLSRTADICRWLMRPGGHMILLEICSDSLWPQLIVCGLPGWWRGHDDGRVYHPTISETEWDCLLKSHGFSGLDHAYKDFEEDSRSTFSVMHTQAIDTRVQVLRKPLVAGDAITEVESIMIVGAQDANITHFSQDIRTLLLPFAENVTVINGFDDIELGMLGPRNAVMWLFDLLEPAFKNLRSESLKIIQTLFLKSKYVLWVTRGCHVNDPYANMIVGIGRTVMMESPSVQLQFMDIDSLEISTQSQRILCEALLRMIYLDRKEYGNILWSSETETTILENNLYIPRIRPDSYMNDRVNARRRAIYANTLPESHYPIVHQHGSSYLLDELPTDDMNGGTRLEIRVCSSTSLPISTTDGKLHYLCVGKVLGSDRKVIMLSPTNTSLVTTSNQIFDVDAGTPNDEVLQRIIVAVLCESLLSRVSSAVWINTPNACIADIVSGIAARWQLQIFVSTAAPSRGSLATNLHACITERELLKVIPPNIQHIIDLDGAATLPLRDMASCLHELVDIRIVREDIAREKKISLHYDSRKFHDIVKRQIVFLTSMRRNRGPEIYSQLSTVNTVPKTDTRQVCLVRTIDWTNCASTPIRIAPFSVSGLFSDQKTYFLVGLSGGLGLSLCEWMIRHGARNLAVASRSPEVPIGFIRRFESYGATFKTFVLDVANRQALVDVHNEISSSMPPIGGVANGAMVLRDIPFEQLLLEDIEIVLQPKVEGSKNLDNLFHSTDLDFFILFSSMGSIIGNPGQSSYAAANMFMSTLAAQRRERGVAASVINIALLLGVGYATEAIQEGHAAIEKQLQKLQYPSISESDFHDMFTAAVISGKPSRRMDHDIVTGFNVRQNAPWARIPRFWHFISSAKIRESTQQTLPSNSIQELLKKASNNEEIISIIETSFARKLGLILQLPVENIDKTVPLTTLGLDSLVAVEIRSWFLREFEVDIPVIKVLSGASLRNICLGAVERLPKHSSRNADGSRENMGASQFYLRNLKGESAPQVHEERPTTAEATSSSLQDEIIPMSHAQARLYFWHEYLQDKSACNVVYFGIFKGGIDVDRLRTAVQRVGKHHTSLRSSYYFDELSSQPVQVINPEPLINFEHRIIKDKKEIQENVESLRKRNFSIELGRTMAVSILSETQTDHHIVIAHHHIVLDGLSWVIFVRDLHRSFLGFQPAGPPMPMARKEKIKRATEDWQRELKFWGALHVSPPSALPLLPFAKVKERQILKTYDTETIETRLDTGLSKRLRQVASEIQATPFHIYLSILAALLARCCDSNDFCIGVIDANRTEPRDEEVVGYFLNFLPLRFRLEPNEPFLALARRTSKMTLEALENSRAPFDRILDHLETARHGNHHPLFQVALNYRMGVELQTLGDGHIDWTGSIPASTPYDLSVDITETPTGTILALSFQKYLYHVSDMKLLLKWYTRALEGFSDDLTKMALDCPISNRSDLQHANTLIEPSSMEITWDGTLIHRIEVIAAKYPDSLAVKDGMGQELSYYQLVERSNQIACWLNTRHLPRGSFVAMLLDPAVDVISSMIAVMKLGLVWVPLDLRNHEERLWAILADCQPKALIFNAESKGLADNFHGQVQHLLNIDDILCTDSILPDNVSERQQPAVVLYTSGSTGSPKGVLLTHGNILNQIFVNTSLFCINREVVLQQTAYSFDLALDQIFHALANGGKLIIVSKQGRGDPNHIAKTIYEESVTYTLLVPSEYMSVLHYSSRLLGSCRSWRFAFAGGEKISPQLKRGFRRLGIPDLKLINLYGPTEASIGCARGIVPYYTEQDVESQVDSVYTMPNYLVATLDRRFELVPVGFPGEICIAGTGLARGYINRPEETQRSFIRDASSSPKNGCKLKGTRFYRTGDIGRILEDGSLNILGRIGGDGQIKIRGVRIELDDIANVIIKTAGSVITSAAVSLREGDTLVAFVVLDSTFEGDQVHFLRQIKSKLPVPPYMRPRYIVPVEQLPRNNHGKLDRLAINALRVPNYAPLVPSFNLTTAEARLKDVWEEVLPHQTIRRGGINAGSDFFHAGGNSVLLIKLRAALKGTFGVTLSLSKLFRDSTLGAMALNLEHDAPPESGASQIDWALEVAGLTHQLPQPQATRRPESRSSLIVALTGATGFLGTHVLQHLVDSGEVAEVHCLAIRRDDQGSPRHVRIRSSKVLEYPGDLNNPLLGLSAADFQSLIDRVDLVIHNGADVSFLKTYHSLRRANVVSTRTLCELAIPRRVPLHFVSTASVAKLASQSVLPEISVLGNEPSPVTSDGYTASKWASEALLERAAADWGLPAWVHRPATIIGEEASKLDVMSSILHYSRLLRATPDLTDEIVSGSFDFVRVEDVASDLVEIAIASTTGSPDWGVTAPTFAHHCSDLKVSASGLREWLEESEGCHFEGLELATPEPRLIAAFNTRGDYGTFENYLGSIKYMDIPFDTVEWLSGVKIVKASNKTALDEEESSSLLSLSATTMPFELPTEENKSGLVFDQDQDFMAGDLPLLRCAVVGRVKRKSGDNYRPTQYYIILLQPSREQLGAYERVGVGRLPGKCINWDPSLQELVHLV
ncbi:hypothetical protein Hte_008872 [Hypoxylon texense]